LATYPTLEYFQTFNCADTYKSSASDFDYNTVTKIVPREPVPIGRFDSGYIQFLEKYGHKYFLDIYFKIRIIESDKKLSPNNYKAKLRKVYRLLDHISLQKAINYIDFTTKQTRIYNKDNKASFKINYLNSQTKSGFTFATENDKIEAPLGQSGGTGGY
jgi:hypothetical protein